MHEFSGTLEEVIDFLNKKIDNKIASLEKEIFAQQLLFASLLAYIDIACADCNRSARDIIFDAFMRTLRNDNIDCTPEQISDLTEIAKKICDQKGSASIISFPTE